MKRVIIDIDYFKSYRQYMGFNNQSTAKAFLSAKDIMPSVDFNYIESLNIRLFEIIDKLNFIVSSEIKIADIDKFKEQFILKAYLLMKGSNIIAKLNNQGRRPEEVYFSWMRGYTIANYFMKALSIMFGIDVGQIEMIGGDDLKNIDTFKRTPTADLQLNFNDIGLVRIEVQSGFQGTNDIKQHKVIEAKKIFLEKGIITIVVHFDVYNGQVAVVRLDNINDNDINWITRQQMEGQTVFNIDQNLFVWKLTEKCLTKEEIKELIITNE